jgi:ABC-type branched-subunit amino acid transport system substrate-binding protein
MKGSKSSMPFERDVQKKYGRPATAEISYGYDLGVIVGTTLSRVKGEPSAEALLSAFRKDLCFRGLSTGEICFAPAGGHGSRTVNFVRFTKDGFVLVN